MMLAMAVVVWSSPPPPPRRHNGNKVGGRVKADATKKAIATVTRVVSNDDGDGDGDKCNGDIHKIGGRATTWAIAIATSVTGDNERNCDGNEGGKRQIG